MNKSNQDWFWPREEQPASSEDGKKGIVAGIKRFSKTDGPGTRTTISMKGCLLHCLWCCHPESIGFAPEVVYNPAECINCGRCATECTHGAHQMTAGKHFFDRSLCLLCLDCVEHCPQGALRIIGREMQVNEILSLLERDREVFEQTGGGLTLSGGEPTAQFDFSLALLQQARRMGLHTCIKSNGFGPPVFYRELIPLVDLFIWDMKHTDNEKYESCTGVPFDFVRKNILAMDKAGKESFLRCILVDQFNSQEDSLDGIASFCRRLNHCRGIQLIPFHCKSNYSRPEAFFWPPENGVPTDAQFTQARDVLEHKWGLVMI